MIGYVKIVDIQSMVVILMMKNNLEINRLSRFCLKMKIMVNNYILYPIGFSDTIMHIVEMKRVGKNKEE